LRRFLLKNGRATADNPRMPHVTLADRADRWLARLFPTRFRPGAPEWRHGKAGTPHLWRMQRAFQIDFLQRMGLSPDHRLLDLGCGTLRGGLPLVGYLASHHYTGIDIRPECIAEARRELEEAGLRQRHPRIEHVDGLEGLELGETFDYIWAFSVLVHLEDDELDTALAFAARHLQSEGVFYANVNLGDGRLGSWSGFPIVARPIDWYAERARLAGLDARSIGRLRELGHVSGDRNADSQFMVRFRKSA
jgi:SAM-dependent methyltransferase